jgi:hypothetical protein
MTYLLVTCGPVLLLYIVGRDTRLDCSKQTPLASRFFSWALGIEPEVPELVEAGELSAERLG